MKKTVQRMFAWLLTAAMAASLLQTTTARAAKTADAGLTAEEILESSPGLSLDYDAWWDMLAAMDVNKEELSDLVILRATEAVVLDTIYTGVALVAQDISVSIQKFLERKLYGASSAEVDDRLWDALELLEHIDGEAVDTARKTLIVLYDLHSFLSGLSNELERYESAKNDPNFQERDALEIQNNARKNGIRFLNFASSALAFVPLVGTVVSVPVMIGKELLKDGGVVDRLASRVAKTNLNKALTAYLAFSSEEEGRAVARMYRVVSEFDEYIAREKEAAAKIEILSKFFEVKSFKLLADAYKPFAPQLTSESTSEEKAQDYDFAREYVADLQQKVDDAKQITEEDREDLRTLLDDLRQYETDGWPEDLGEDEISRLKNIAEKLEVVLGIDPSNPDSGGQKPGSSGSGGGYVDSRKDPVDETNNTAGGGGVGKAGDSTNVAATTTVDPLALSIDGAGIATLPLSQGVYFDHMGSGFRVRTGWVGENTGLLARDLNGNGRIDNGGELFGDNTLLKDGTLAVNGFEALSDLCDTEDGIFDERSEAYNELYLWFDYNGNARTDEGELVTLAEAGVASIDLDYQNSDYVDDNGNAFLQTGIGTLTDGTVIEVADIWFARVIRDSWAVDEVEVSEEVYYLPNLRGFGTVYSLHQAMMRDESGTLKGLIIDFMNEADEDARRSLTDEILYQWTGSPTKLGALEALLGTPYTGNTNWAAMDILNKAFDEFSALFYEILMSQSHFFYLYNKMEEDDRWDENIDFSGVADALLEELYTDRAAGEKLLVDFLYNIHAILMTNRIDGSTFQDRIAWSDPRGGALTEAMRRKVYKAKLGGETLTGSAVGDFFMVSSSENQLNGLSGDDIYVFEASAGNTTVSNLGGNHTVLLPCDGDEVSASAGAGVVVLTTPDFDIRFEGVPKGADYTLLFMDGSSRDLMDMVDFTEVSTAAELAGIGYDLGGFYRLTADIDLSGEAWSPLGTEGQPYSGSLLDLDAVDFEGP